MKANPANFTRTIALSISLAACGAGAEPPEATPSAAAQVAAQAASVTEPTYENYLDAPQTPGDWTYIAERDETFALFGLSIENPQAIIRCDLDSRKVGIGRFGSDRGTAVMRIRTETRQQILEASTRDSGQPLVAAEMDARDPILDAMALSKGRFAIETEGTATLYLPAWAEVTRVIEDCR